VTRPCIEWLEAPVIEDQELRRYQAEQDPAVPPAGSGQRQFGKQLWHSLVEHGPIVPAGSMAQRRRQPTLPDAGRAAQDQIVMRVDPGAGRQPGIPSVAAGQSTSIIA